MPATASSSTPSSSIPRISGPSWWSSSPTHTRPSAASRARSGESPPAWPRLGTWPSPSTRGNLVNPPKEFFSWSSPRSAISLVFVDGSLRAWVLRGHLDRVFRRVCS